MDNPLRGMLVPSPPRCSDPAAVPPVLRGLRAVVGSARLSGVLTGTEAPAAARPVSYDYPGDPETARVLAAGWAARIPVVLTEEPALPLDDATVIPLRYLTPGGRLSPD